MISKNANTFLEFTPYLFGLPLIIFGSALLTYMFYDLQVENNNKDVIPDTWISKLFWLSIIRTLKKFKYPSIQVSSYPWYPSVHVSKYPDT